MELRIAILQYDIVWEDKKENFKKIEELTVKCSEKFDILLLPEMFSTAFSMNAEKIAETNDGETMKWAEKIAKQQNCAVCGSFAARENGNFFNRAFFITETGEKYFYDKRHLFTMGSENSIYSPGEETTIINYKGCKFSLFVCYDLRFPVWSRNTDGKYDIAIYTANWPTSRISVWNTLLTARALENQCIVCGVNRIGKDNAQLDHCGHSAIISAKGEKLMSFQENEENIKIAEIDIDALHRFRQKFAVLNDADNFKISI